MKDITSEALKYILKDLNINSFSDLDETKFLRFLELIENKFLEFEKQRKKLTILEKDIQKIIGKEVEKIKQKEEELLFESKTESVNEMLANIAHQWRQPLSTISSAASGLSIQIELGIAKPEDVTDSLLKIVSFTQFLSDTIEDFRDFFKKDKELHDVNLVDLIKETINIVEISYQDNFIEIQNNFTNELSENFNSSVYKSELSQVFLNIFNNAKDILIERDVNDRKIIIDYQQNDEFNIISIFDNGGGINETIKNKVFDAYYTTKHKSIGTGIGLYLSKKIVEKNLKGYIYVNNVSRKVEGKDYLGAEFVIEIPKL